MKEIKGKKNQKTYLARLLRERGVSGTYEEVAHYKCIPTRTEVSFKV